MAAARTCDMEISLNIAFWCDELQKIFEKYETFVYNSSVEYKTLWSPCEFSSSIV